MCKRTVFQMGTCQRSNQSNIPILVGTFGHTHLRAHTLLMFLGGLLHACSQGFVLLLCFWVSGCLIGRCQRSKGSRLWTLSNRIILISLRLFQSIRKRETDIHIHIQIQIQCNIFHALLTKQRKIKMILYQDI